VEAGFGLAWLCWPVAGAAGQFVVESVVCVAAVRPAAEEAAAVGAAARLAVA
jgi:hypothetical protein